MSGIARLFGVELDDEDGLVGALMMFEVLRLVRQWMTTKKK